MCGRFTLTLDAIELQEALQIGSVPADYRPRYNVAPTQPVSIVIDPVNRNLEWARWGLVPSWADDPSVGSRFINARSETITEKPTFRRSFASQRCLIIADGFYEWKRPKSGNGRSIPYFFRRQDQKPFAFAGIWEIWRSKEGQELRSCSIITCAANSTVAPIHERMPVILNSENIWAWLEKHGRTELLSMLVPYPPDLMTTYPVSSMVNRPELDKPELILPVGG